MRHVFRLNRRINERLDTIWSRLRDATGRRAFAASERAWRIYIAKACATRSRAFAGGSAAPAAYGTCQEQLTAAHLRDLTKTAQDLAPH